MTWSVLPSLTSRADQRGVLGRGGDEEPGIDRDAVATDAGAGLEDVDARVAVGEADDLPHVDAEAVGDEAQLVGEGDVDVAERILGQLGHLGGTRGGGDAGAADEAAVEAERLARAARGDAADDAVVVDQLDQDAAGQHALGAVGDRDIGGSPQSITLWGSPGLLAGAAGDPEVGTKFGEQVADLFGGADRRGRFEDDRVARLQDGGDAGRGGEDVADVGAVIVGERGRHRDDEDVGGGDLGRGGEQAARDDARDEAVEIDLLDMDAALVDGVDDRAGHVDAEHAHAGARDHRGGGQADVAQPHHHDFGREHLRLDGRGHGRGSPRSVPRHGRRRTDCGRGPWRRGLRYRPEA